MKHIWKKTWSILLALVMLFSLVPGMSGTAYAAEASVTLKSGTRSSGPISTNLADMMDNLFVTGAPATISASDKVITKLVINKGSFYNTFNASGLSISPGTMSFNSNVLTVTDINSATVTLRRLTNTNVSISSIIVYYDDPIAVTDVSLNKTSTSLTAGNTETLTATVAPNNATNKSVTWTSSDNNIATVSNGVVTAKAAGTATITVTTNDGNKTATCAVTVESSTVNVTGVSLNKTETTLTVGGTETLTATVSPEDATDKSVTWSSDNTAVATVADGVVTAVASGTANITVTTTDGAKSATCAVTVTNPAITINPSVFTGAYDGSAHGVTVTVTDPPSGATVKYGYTSDTCTLPTSPTITNVAESPLTVYYRVTAVGYSEYLGWATVEISKADQTAPAAPTAVSVSTNSITLTAIENGEYKCNDGEWKTNPTFDGLTMNTSYTFYQRLAADDNHNASSPSAGASISTSNHVHNWGYEALGATITATCGNTDGGHDGSTTATLTVNATDSTYTGSAYAGASLDTAAWTAAVLTAPTIEYAGRGSTSYTKSTTAPTNAGDYTASVTVEGQTASVDFTIGKASINPGVTLDGWTYGATANTPNVTGNTDNGTVTFSYAQKGSSDFSATVPANAGEYTVKATVAPTTNYNSGEATADFTIAKATVTVSAQAKSKTYGETTDPALTYSASGLVGSDALTGELTREVGENARTYAIGQGTLTAGDNYTISYTGADFTINKAAITITADDKSSKYGDDLVELTYTIGGAYKAGDELNVTLNTTASKTADVGEYEITVAYNNANYDATLVKGKYTVTKTGLTVTAAGYTGSYDGNPHGITVDVGSSGASVYYAESELTAENYATTGSTTALTYTEAGENTVYFYVVSGNYDPDTVSGSKTVIITKATGTATDAQKPTAKTDLVADNTDQALVTAPASLPEGYTAIQYSLDGETWTDTAPTGKDAGNYTVNYKYVGDSNHNDFQGEPIAVSIKTLTVTFEVNGGSAVAAQSVIKGEKAQKPDDPTKAGNAFDGWFQDATFSFAFDFDTPITADTTLYAKWTPNDYTLTSITGTSTDISHIWTKDSNVSVVVTVKLATEPDNSFAHYVRTEIDGIPVAATAREGSTVVTLAPAELQRLSVGAHTVSIVFDNGRVDTRLTVRRPSSTPSTGDESHAALWATILAVSALGMAAVVVNTKKRRTAKR